MEVSSSRNNSKERSRKGAQLSEIKIQIDSASRTSSNHPRGASSDGTLSENSSTEAHWNRDPKQPKIYHPKPPKKACKEKNQHNISSSHSFLTDVADMRSMEAALVQLLSGRHCSTEQMEAIRDQQEKLARLHFELGAQHGVNSQHNSKNMNELVSALEHLSQTIEQLHPNASPNQSDSN